MKTALLFILYFFTASTFAQTVNQVNGEELVIGLHSSRGWDVGDAANVLDRDFKTTGTCEITKISASGRSALCRLKTGSAQVGMNIEPASHGVQNEQKKEDSVKSERVIDHSLTEEDQRILERGEISTGRYVVGGILGTYPIGMGIGHAIQGRYSERGWIFTVGEASSLVVLVAGLARCIGTHWGNDCNNGLTVLGIVGYAGFRIWEIIDVWAVPPMQNQRYRELKSRMGLYRPEIEWRPALVPLADGAALGLQVRF